MLTKKYITKYSKVTVIKQEFITKQIKTFKTTVKQRTNTELTLYMPMPYTNLDIKYPTKKNQNNFRTEDNKIIYEKDGLRVIFEQ